MLDRVGDAEGAVDGDGHADDKRDTTTAHALGIAQLLSDHGELARRRVEDPRLQLAPSHVGRDRSRNPHAGDCGPLA